MSSSVFHLYNIISFAYIIFLLSKYPCLFTRLREHPLVQYHRNFRRCEFSFFSFSSAVTCSSSAFPCRLCLAFPCTCSQVSRCMYNVRERKLYIYIVRSVQLLSIHPALYGVQYDLPRKGSDSNVHFHHTVKVYFFHLLSFVFNSCVCRQ